MVKLYPQYDYEFSTDMGVLELSDAVREKHRFELINVTLSGPACFGSPFAQSMIPVGGIDVVVMNNVMQTLKQGGMLLTTHDEYYYWNRRDIVLYSNAAEWLSFKFNLLLKSVALFFMLSAITALLVRVLISSGVVLLFPIFWCLQLFGIEIVSTRLISLSYPWIGLPMEMLRHANQSHVPFVISHITRVVIYYVFYEATQFALAL